MNDTPDHVRRIYADFIMQKTETERFQMGFEMADVGHRMVEESIRQLHPDWSEAERKVAVFERIYRADFTADKMKQIMTSIIAHHDQQTV